VSPNYPVPVNSEIRYVGFRPSEDGGRRFEFAVKSPSREISIVVMDIPGSMFTGANRILLQEGAGICMAKLRSLHALAGSEPLPIQVRLTEDDIREYREVIVPKERTPWGTSTDRQHPKSGEEETGDNHDGVWK
jgi:hypothetical protein